MKKNKIKVLCAMSGGVDSSVAAALLKKAGFEVKGVFMKVCPDLEKKQLNSEEKARKVAAALNIPFHIFDFQKEFEKKIINYFLREYEAGRTPNPCVVCNKEIKFGLLFKKSLSLKADFFATGHYVKVKKISNKFYLFKAKDKKKDQSYFLWKLNQKQLSRVLFPIGDYNKKEVKEMARKFKLPVLKNKESQEVCFIPGETKEFLLQYINPKPGKIINKEGEVIGKHLGLFLYTIGQRKGIKLSGGPYYVSEKNIKKNLLIVSKKEKDLFSRELYLKDISWISGKKPRLPLRIKAKIRYRHEETEAIVSYDKKLKVYCLKFRIAQRAVTPGQSAVFYNKKNELIGGGIIK